MPNARYAHIGPDGVCDNVIVLNPDDPDGYPLTGLVPIEGLTPMPWIGWTYSGGSWTRPPSDD
ncbi:hypothetical protein [Nocardioides sp.]|uniref:hypothetical protein n=1 Tax=Nocardioides sp. TaxID=35761 RepID=UPI0035125BDE